NSLSMLGEPHWLLGMGDGVAALLAAGILLALGIRQARCSQHAEWIYGLAVFGCAVGIYLRLLIVGLAPVTVWDTSALIIVTYVLFALQRLTQSVPFLHVVMVLPVFTLLTVPMQFASPHTSVT